MWRKGAEPRQRAWEWSDPLYEQAPAACDEVRSLPGIVFLLLPRGNGRMFQTLGVLREVGSW